MTTTTEPREPVATDVDDVTPPQNVDAPPAQASPAPAPELPPLPRDLRLCPELFVR